MCEQSFETHKSLCSTKMEDGRSIISSQLPAVRKIVLEPQTMKLLSFIEKTGRTKASKGSVKTAFKYRCVLCNSRKYFIKVVAEGHLGGSAVEGLPLAQGMILGSWD